MNHSNQELPSKTYSMDYAASGRSTASTMLLLAQLVFGHGQRGGLLPLQVALLLDGHLAGQSFAPEAAQQSSQSFQQSSRPTEPCRLHERRSSYLTWWQGWLLQQCCATWRTGSSCGRRPRWARPGGGLPRVRGASSGPTQGEWTLRTERGRAGSPGGSLQPIGPPSLPRCSPCRFMWTFVTTVERRQGMMSSEDTSSPSLSSQQFTQCRSLWTGNH